MYTYTLKDILDIYASGIPACIEINLPKYSKTIYIYVESLHGKCGLFRMDLYIKVKYNECTYLA